LESELRTKGVENAEVYNFGIGASILRQDVIRIMFEMASYKPDLIVHYSGANDFGGFNIDPRINYPHRFYLDEFNPLKELKAKSFPTLNALLLSSQFLRTNFPDFLIERIVNPHLSNIHKHRPRIEHYSEMRAHAAFENILWAEKISKSIGANYVFVLQPTVNFKKVRHQNEWQFSNQVFIDQVHLFLNLMSKSSFKKNFLNLSDLFKDEPRYVFSDEMHLVSLEDNVFPAKKITDYILTHRLHVHRNQSNDSWKEPKYFKW
jgi:hypothetical protein